MSELKSNDLLEMLGKMVVQVDKNNTVLNVNSFACKTLGYNFNEMVGYNWFEKFVPKGSAQKSTTNPAVTDLIYDKPILTKMGVVKLISWQRTAVFGDSGELERVVCVGEDISKSDNYLITLHKISTLLLKETSSVPYGEFVQLIGNAANADHTYIFINQIGDDGQFIAKKISEWGKGKFINNEDVLPGLNEININSFENDWVKSLKLGNLINLNASVFPKFEQEFFVKIGVQSILLIPIMINNKFFGFIGFDNRVNEREWTNSELEFLKASVKNLEQKIVSTQVRTALELENAKFHTTMDSIDSIVVVSNLITQEIVFINTIGERVFGNVIGKKIEDAIVIDSPLPNGYCDNSLLLDSNKQPLDTQEWVLENKLKGLVFNSRVKVVKWANNELVRLETIVDVSEKIKFELTLLDSEAKFKKLSALTTEGILIHENGKVLDSNLAFSNILQYSNEETKGVNIIDLVVLPQYHQVVYDNLKHANPNPYVVYARRKDGTTFPTEVQAKSVDYRGEVIRVVAIRDITERIKNEKELIKQKEKAEESNRLKTQLLNNMSHEIRTPLNGIVGFTQFLDDPTISSEKKSHFISIIKSSGHQLVRIIDDIIEISKLETKQVKARNEAVNLNSLLLELFSIFELKAKEKNISLHLKKGLKDLQSEIYTDKTKLLKVLNNLVENALKFTNQGFVEIGCRLSNNKINIWVKDSGVGIPIEKQKLVFERFSQADSEISAKFGGLGLGLSIAMENTQLLGGEIRIDSNYTQGALFDIKLPFNPVFEIGDEEIEINEKYDYHVLVAEDEEINFIFLEFLLHNLNAKIKVSNVRNGEEAINYVSNNTDIDIIFMDIKMPVMNGLDATRIIRETNPKLPIIAITAYSGYSDEQKALEAGCTNFLTKPIDAEKFISLCEKIFLKPILNRF